MACVRPTGVALADGRDGVATLAHVHAALDDFVVTSDVPCDASLLDAPVLGRALPGALGRYLLPVDAVLHLPRRHATTVADLRDLVAREEAALAARTAAVASHAQQLHLSVAAPTAEDATALAADEEEEDDDEQGDDDDEGGDEDQEPPPDDDDDNVRPAEPAWESDDEAH
jgi:hypothetical protein